MYSVYRVPFGTLVVALVSASLTLLSVAPIALADPPPADVTAVIDDGVVQSASGGCALSFDNAGVVVASTSLMLRTEFVGANPVVPVADASAPLSTVTYSDLWDGVTLVYESIPGAVAKSTYYLDDGSLADSVRLRFNLPVSLDTGGNLVFARNFAAMSESAPVAWQDLDGRRHFVDVAFELHADGTVGFRLGEHVPGVPVVIDPWLTFLGGDNGDYAYDIAIDGSGNVYVAGASTSTWGSPVRLFSDSVSYDPDAMVAKLNSRGELVWHTFLGNTHIDVGSAIEVDDAGIVYVAGKSEDTWESPGRAHSGDEDAFVASLDPDGALLWNTFLGGSAGDQAIGIALDDDGNIYVCGDSKASWQGDSDPKRLYSSGSDGFVAMLDDTGTLQWNTFLGGDALDEASAVTLNADGDVLVAGMSYDTWQGDVEPTHAFTAVADAFVAELDGSGALQWYTFLGGDGEDGIHGIAVDDDGSIYVAGGSYATWGAPVREYDSDWDGFAAKLDTGGNLIWNTFLGGSGEDQLGGIAVGDDGNVSLGGYSTTDWGSPVRDYTDSIDAIAARLDNSGNLVWHTFLGSSGIDYSFTVAANDDGRVYIAGTAGAAWGVLPVRPFMASPGDAFVAVLDNLGRLTYNVYIPLQIGWNLVSVPVTADDMSASAVFEGAGHVYEWHDDVRQYSETTTIDPYCGYWVESSSVQTITISGWPLLEWSSTLDEGKTMVGSICGEPMAVGDLDVEPDDALDDDICWWDPVATGYVSVTQLEQGKGHWATCSESCNLDFGRAL